MHKLLSVCILKNFTNSFHKLAINAWIGFDIKINNFLILTFSLPHPISMPYALTSECLSGEIWYQSLHFHKLSKFLINFGCFWNFKQQMNKCFHHFEIKSAINLTQFSWFFLVHKLVFNKYLLKTHTWSLIHSTQSTGSVAYLMWVFLDLTVICHVCCCW